MHSRQDILNFSKIIEEYGEYLNSLETISNKFDLYYFIRAYGPYYGILLFRSFIIEKTISLVNNTNDKTNSFEFSETELNLSKFSTHTTTHPKIQEITTYDLFACIVKLKNFSSTFIIDKFKTKKLLINCQINNIKISFQETFKRIILPFYLPVLTLIASLIIIKSKDDYEFFKYKFGLFILGVITIIISEVSIRYSSSNILENIYLVSLPIFSFFFIYIYFKIKLRKPVMIN